MQFDTQIVVISQLTADKHSALRVLSNHAKEADVRRFLTESAALKKQGATLEAARKARLEAIVNMMKNLNYTEEKAMDTLEIPAEERSMYMVWLTKV